MTDRVKGYLEIALAVLLAVLVWWGYNWVFDRGVAAEHVERVKDQQAYTAALQKSRDEGLAKEYSMQLKMDNERRTKDEQIVAINRSLSAALAGLRDRKERPGGADLSKITGSGATCTGANLFRQDAEFLVGEAARADGLRAQLQQCQAAYANARQSLAPQP